MPSFIVKIFWCVSVFISFHKCFITLFLPAGNTNLPFHPTICNSKKRLSELQSKLHLLIFDNTIAIYNNYKVIEADVNVDHNFNNLNSKG